MYKAFHDINELYNELERDKNCSGAGSSILNRYPLRFVLFENFSDFNAFVMECANRKVYVQGIEKMIDDNCNDNMLTHSQLADLIIEHIKHTENDFVLAPFSEVARFYDNNNTKEFDSLLKSIRLTEATASGQRVHQRIYLPIIGMQSKVSKFKTDPNIHIWEYVSSSEGESYKLILTYGTMYCVRGLDSFYATCHNYSEWLSLWKKGSEVRNGIICSSKSIFNCSEFAQPDNAFEYIVCKNAYEFLVKGLALFSGDIQFKEEELRYWETLAALIDVSEFNGMESLISKQLKTFPLESEADFVRAWLKNNDDFKHWLLKNYFLSQKGKNSYLTRVLENCETLNNVELLSNLATQIFNMPYSETYLSQRLLAINEAIGTGGAVTQIAEVKVKAQLEKIAQDPEGGYIHAMKYMTPLTQSEKVLMVRWLGQGHITRESIKDIFPDLYHYTEPLNCQLDDDIMWVNKYTEEYCKSKIANKVTPKLSETLNEKNASPILFSQWKERFKTVKTYLYDRGDIDVYYWIDGLGIDWIPYFKYIIEKHSANGAYLNEIYIATAELPTTTEVNKAKLEEFAKEKLEKIGDIDESAHKTKDYPLHILEEFQIMSKSICNVLDRYNNKKIAFISDHGISYLAALSDTPMKLGGYISKHSGRYAETSDGTDAEQDNSYIILDDKRTICSLTHKSLQSKTKEGTGAHGGATPEEVLVPIIIVSREKRASTYSPTLLEKDISATFPCVKYKIGGITNIDSPRIIYDDVEYGMTLDHDNIYVSQPLALSESAHKVQLVIGEYSRTDNINVNVGIEEDDLFGDL